MESAIESARYRLAVQRDMSPRSLDVPVALNGGNIWAGFACDDDALEELVTEATSTSVKTPIMMQYHPDRVWLWKQWFGTIVRSVRVSALLNTAFAVVVVLSFWHLSHSSNGSIDAVLSRIAPVNQLWTTMAGLVTFVLSFFLNQAYSVWRECYSASRRIQGRLNDIGLLAASHARREFDRETGEYVYQPESQAVMEEIARYTRLFNILFYSTVSRRYAPLQTPKGLRALQSVGAITERERIQLLESGTNHNGVMVWLTAIMSRSIQNGALTGGMAIHKTMLEKLTELRATYASVGDKLSGRMPLAYPHFVQLLIDTFVLMTPFSCYFTMGPAAVIATLILTVFYEGMLDLAKILLDPYDNEDYGGRSGIYISVDTLIQETNLGSRRWLRGGTWVPDMSMPFSPYSPPRQIAAAQAASPAPATEFTAPTPDGGGGNTLVTRTSLVVDEASSTRGTTTANTAGAVSNVDEDDDDKEDGADDGRGDRGAPSTPGAPGVTTTTAKPDPNNTILPAHPGVLIESTPL